MKKKKFKYDHYCKCGYAMLDCGYYWICTKCSRIKYKKDLLSKTIQLLIKIKEGKER